MSTPTAAPTARERAKRLVTSQTTPLLATALLAIDAQVSADPDAKAEDAAYHRMVRAWLIDELEVRYPAASDVVAAAFEAQETMLMQGKDAPDPDYVALLLGAIPADQL